MCDKKKDGAVGPSRFLLRRLYAARVKAQDTAQIEKTEKAALDILGKDTEHYIVKSKTITTAGIELTAELRTKEASTGFVNLISRLPGVENATLVSYNGEYLS